ncbi:serine protease [Streptomyces sp. NPDC050315]|uniref:serine protease n=1 Tax=Streptomyces sp. NPDC050315 TaxID=3155039 RepID=UPI003425A2A4
MVVQAADAAEALVRIRDLAGRPRGTGFLADPDGTLLTSHEAVDGLARLVLQGAAGRTCAVGADAVTPLPESGLALVRTTGLGLPPLPVAAGRPEPGTQVRLYVDGDGDGDPGKQAGVSAERASVPVARVVGRAAVVYTATDRRHHLPDAVELAVPGPAGEALRLGGPAVGGLVTDAGTGAVLAVVGTALHCGRPAGSTGVLVPHAPGAAVPRGFAIPLHAAAAADPRGPLAALLARNAATVPAYGPDLNLAGVLALTTTAMGTAGGPGPWREPVERPEVAEEFAAFGACTAATEPVGGTPVGAPAARVLALVGDTGTGRSTELAALAARRARAVAPAPTLRLRGADLRAADRGLRDAVGRALRAAGRVLSASGPVPGDPAAATPEEVAGLARAAGRPLLVLLDGPEELPPDLAERLADWTRDTAEWLHGTGARLIVACRPEYWETAGAHFPVAFLHRPRHPAVTPPGAPAGALPPCVRLGDLAPREAARARARYGLPAGALTTADAGHPLALRLLTEVRTSLVAAGEDARGMGTPHRHEIFGGYLDLLCLRVAQRLARPGERGADVRRSAARVAGRAHEAARRCLAPGRGELDRASFDELFPWRTGWASAVLAEGLLVPAGAGYRFPHEEFADWLQGTHLDVAETLDALVHGPTGGRAGQPPAAAPPAVPRHRIGPVVQALLLLGRRAGPEALGHRLEGLVEVVTAPGGRSGERTGTGGGAADASVRDARWWAEHLLGEVLLRLPDAAPYARVLHLLAARVTDRSALAGGFGRTGLDAFGPWFWRRLPLDPATRLDLVRRLLPADGPPPENAATGEEDGTAAVEGAAAPGPRFLGLAAALLCADPRRVQPLLCRWFDDERPLQRGRSPVRPGADAGPPQEPTVAAAAQALLHTHRRRATDGLTEALAATAHPRADELLTALAEDEPAALCRAVDRWARDDRPARRAAAAAYALVVAAHAATDADRELLRQAARTLLERPADPGVHGAALALLVGDRATRSRYLDRALAGFTAGDPALPPAAFTAALTSHPEPVLTAFQTRLRRSPTRTGQSAMGGGAGMPQGATGGEPSDAQAGRPEPDAAEAVLRTLAGVSTPALARRAAALVDEYAIRFPWTAARPVADFVAHRLEAGPGARSVLQPLAVRLLTAHAAPVRCALVPVLARPGSTASCPLRQELLDVLLERERTGRRPSGAPDPVPAAPDATVLDALLCAAAQGAARRPEAQTRDLVHRTGLLHVRTLEGAARFDRRLVELGRLLPDFATMVRTWLAAAPAEWAAIVGPSARAMLGPRSPAPTPANLPAPTRPLAHGAVRTPSQGAPHPA